MRILITGGSGLLGLNLSQIASCEHQLIISHFKHSVELSGFSLVSSDIINRSEVNKVIKFYKPGIIVYIAALVNVDFCEGNRRITEKTNVYGKGNYKENDEANPPNYYAEAEVIGKRPKDSSLDISKATANLKTRFIDIDE